MSELDKITKQVPASEINPNVDGTKKTFEDVLTVVDQYFTNTDPYTNVSYTKGNIFPQKDDFVLNQFIKNLMTLIQENISQIHDNDSEKKTQTISKAFKAIRDILDILNIQCIDNDNKTIIPTLIKYCLNSYATYNNKNVRSRKV